MNRNTIIAIICGFVVCFGGLVFSTVAYVRLEKRTWGLECENHRQEMKIERLRNPPKPVEINPITRTPYIEHTSR